MGLAGPTGAGSGVRGSGSGGVSATVSSLWGGCGWLEAIAALAKSATVSVAALKYGGDSFQPIGRELGRPTRGAS